MWNEGRDFEKENEKEEIVLAIKTNNNELHHRRKGAKIERVSEWMKERDIEQMCIVSFNVSWTVSMLPNSMSFLLHHNQSLISLIIYRKSSWHHLITLKYLL